MPLKPILTLWGDEFVTMGLDGTIRVGANAGFLGGLPAGTNVYERFPHLRSAFEDFLEKAGSATHRAELFLQNERVSLAVAYTPGPPEPAVFIRDMSEERWATVSLKVQHGCGQLLAEATSMEAVAPGLLRLLGEELGWDLTALWQMGPAGELHSTWLWSRPGSKEKGFEGLTRSLTFPPGTGLPGQVWSSGTPLFIPDLKAPPFPLPRLEVATRMASGAAVPIMTSQGPVAVIELFCQTSRRDAAHTIEIITSTGHQLGQFLDRQRLQRLREEDLGWYQAVLSSIGDAVVTADDTGHVTYLNPVAEELTGWEAREAHGRPMAEVFPPEVPGEVPLTARDGSQHFVEARLAPLSAGGTVAVFHDAAQRRETRRKLEESERNLRRLLETSRDAIWIADDAGDITYVNGAFCEMFRTTAAELLGRAVVALLAPGETLRSHGEMRCVREDGEVFWARTSASRLTDEAGQEVGGFAMLSDVTEERQQQEELRRSEARTRSLVEASSQAVWTASPEGRIQESSPSWRQLTGQTEEETRGLGWLDAVHLEDRGRVRAAWEEAVATGTLFAQDFRIWSVQNRFLYLSAKGVPVRSEGTVLEWIVASTDVTERVEAQQELQMRVRLAAFQASVKDALAVCVELRPLLQRCAEAMVARLELSSAALWLEEEFVALGGSWPSSVPTGGTLGAIRANQQPHFSNVLPQGVEGVVLPEGVKAFVGQPVPGGGVIAGLATQVLSVNIMDALKELAEGLAAWVQRLREQEARSLLLAREQEARAEAETLLSLSSTLARETARDSVVDQVTRAATAVTGADFGAFFYNVVDAVGESYMLYSIAGVPREAFSNFPMPRNTDVFRPTFHGEGTVRSGDITKDPRYGHNKPHAGLPPGHLPVRSYLAVSVVGEDGKVLGGLFLGSREVDRFTERHERLAESIASHAAFAFRRSPLT